MLHFLVLYWGKVLNFNFIELPLDLLTAFVDLLEPFEVSFLVDRDFVHFDPVRFHVTDDLLRDFVQNSLSQRLVRMLDLLKPHKLHDVSLRDFAVVVAE